MFWCGAMIADTVLQALSRSGCGQCATLCARWALRELTLQLFLVHVPRCTHGTLSPHDGRESVAAHAMVLADMVSHVRSSLL